MLCSRLALKKEKKRKMNESVILLNLKVKYFLPFFGGKCLLYFHLLLLNDKTQEYNVSFWVKGFYPGKIY